MPGAELVTLINTETIKSVLREDRPVLVACMRDDPGYHENLEELETIALYAGPALKVCIVAEDLLPYFESRYGINGTPTFLVMHHGDVKDALLGKTSVQGLMNFITPHMPGPALGLRPGMKGTNRKIRTLDRQVTANIPASIKAGKKRGLP